MHCIIEIKKNYTITSEYGQYHFANENDAITAFAMITPYCGMEEIDLDDVKCCLDVDGFYNEWPLKISKCEG